MVAQEIQNAGGMPVLVVVDHPPLAEALRPHLEESAHVNTVTTIGSDVDLIEAIDQTSTKVVLIDDQTHSNGLELCRSITAQRPDVSCVVLGNGSTPGAQTSALKAGAAAYLVKSLSGKTVREAVEAVMAGYQQHPVTPQWDHATC